MLRPNLTPQPPENHTLSLLVHLCQTALKQGLDPGLVTQMTHSLARLQDLVTK